MPSATAALGILFAVIRHHLMVMRLFGNFVAVSGDFAVVIWHHLVMILQSG